MLALLTGMSIFPSLMTTAASLSTMPSLWAFFRRAPMRLDTAPSFSLSCFLMSYSPSEAVSLTFPNLSRILSISLSTSGKSPTPDTILFRFG